MSGAAILEAARLTLLLLTWAAALACAAHVGHSAGDWFGRVLARALWGPDD